MAKHIIIEGIFAFLSAFFMILGINFSDKFFKNENLKKALTIISYILMAGCIIYYCYDVIFANYISTFVTIFKIFVLAVGLMLTVLIIAIDFDEFSVHGGFCMISIVISIISFAFIINSIEDSCLDLEYQKNVIVQPAKVSTQKLKLISARDGSTTTGSLNGNLSGSGHGMFFVQRSKVTGNINGTLEEKDIYKFYYVANSSTGEIRLMTLYADDTPLFFIKDDEEPYLLIKTHTPYSLDYNVDPPVECNFKAKYYSYELHIPKNSIVEVFEFDTN